MSYLYKTPIDMPRGAHYGSDYWIVYSYKIKRMVCLYSMLEYANFITLEMTPNIEYFCEQPLRISEAVDGAKISSVFDFWVVYSDGKSEFQEIKYESELNGNSDTSLRSQRQISFQENWCIKNKQNYRVITENDLYEAPFKIQNLELLHSYMVRYKPISKKASETLLELLCQKNLTLEEVKALNIIPENFELSFLAYQYYLGNVELNINNRPIDNNTEVKICAGKNIIL